MHNMKFMLQVIRQSDKRFDRFIDYELNVAKEYAMALMSFCLQSCLFLWKIATHFTVSIRFDTKFSELQFQPEIEIVYLFILS